MRSEGVRSEEWGTDRGSLDLDVDARLIAIPDKKPFQQNHLSSRLCFIIAWVPVFLSMARGFTTFLNCRLCIDGELVHDQLVIDGDSGLILPRTGYIGGDAVDLEDGIIAPGYLELQTNGMLGFHFTHFENEDQYGREIDKVARYLATQGVTGFWVTIPTVADFKKVGTLFPSLPSCQSHFLLLLSTSFDLLP